jgi:multiple sugar transport system permease protein
MTRAAGPDMSSSTTRDPKNGRASSRNPLAASGRRFGLLLAAPATLAVVILVGGPALLTIWNSLFEITVRENFIVCGGGDSVCAWTGLDNYIAIFNSANFQHSLRLTLTYTVGFTALATTLGLAFALLLNERFRLQWLGRTLLIIPWAAPWLMVGIMWKWFIDANVGALNGFLLQFGLIDEYVPWLANPEAAMFFIIAAGAWRQASLSGLLFLAALQTIPHELPEAATVDGASARQRFLYITLPWLMPVLLVVLVTNIIIGFLMFDLIFIMTDGGPGNATQVLSMLLFRLFFNFSNWGAGSALAVVIGLLAFGIGLIFVRFLYSRDSGASAVAGSSD